MPDLPLWMALSEGAHLKSSYILVFAIPRRLSSLGSESVQWPVIWAEYAQLIGLESRAMPDE